MTRPTSERGFALAALILFLTAASVMLAVGIPAYQIERQREMEEELIFRAQEYVRAILKYQRQNGIYPPDLDALFDTNGIRYLRKEYTDPFTGAPFRLLTVNGDGTIEGSTIYDNLMDGGGMFQGMDPQAFGESSSNMPSAAIGTTAVLAFPSMQSVPGAGGGVDDTGERGGDGGGDPFQTPFDTSINPQGDFGGGFGGGFGSNAGGAGRDGGFGGGTAGQNAGFGGAITGGFGAGGFRGGAAGQNANFGGAITGGAGFGSNAAFGSNASFDPGGGGFGGGGNNTGFGPQGGGFGPSGGVGGNGGGDGFGSGTQDREAFARSEAFGAAFNNFQNLQLQQSGDGGNGGFQPNFGAGGIVGVAPDLEGPSLKVYNERERYEEWEFLAIPGYGTVPAPVQQVEDDGLGDGNVQTFPSFNGGINRAP